MQKDNSPFKKWINKRTVRGVAQELGVQVATVRYWRLGLTLPHAAQMRKIVKLSRGRVSYRSMIENHLQITGKK